MECRGFRGPGCLLLVAYGSHPDPWEDRPAHGWRACAEGLGDSVWGVNLNWDEGGGSDPPRCGME